MLGRGPEAAESAYLWEQCEKNPGHKKFASAEHVKNGNIFNPSNLGLLAFGKQHEVLAARIDLTVRLRVNWTSLRRSDGDKLSELRGTDNLRLGTGFIQHVSKLVYNTPCPCGKCDGKMTRKYWTFRVQTAKHVVYNTEEAKKTRVDLFYDEDQMETVWASEVIESISDRDVSDLLCVTHDEALVERIMSAYSCLLDSKNYPIQQHELPFLFNSDTCMALIVSHPHGQPKKVTLGEVRDGGKEDLILKYNTATCPGSSGAPVFLFDPNIEDSLYIPWHAQVHSGNCTKSSTKPNLLERFLQKLWRRKTVEQLNYGYNW